MGFIEIMVIISVVLVLSLIIGSYIYKRIKGIPTGECGCCSEKRKAKEMFNNIRNELNNEKCNCSK